MISHYSVFPLTLGTEASHISNLPLSPDFTNLLRLLSALSLLATVCITVTNPVESFTHGPSNRETCTLPSKRSIYRPDKLKSSLP